MLGREHVQTGFLWGNVMEREHFENTGVDRYNIEVDFQKVRWECMDCMDLVQGMVKWQSLMKVEIISWVP
jgi:hypothetical protein